MSSLEDQVGGDALIRRLAAATHVSIAAGRDSFTNMPLVGIGDDVVTMEAVFRAFRIPATNICLMRAFGRAPSAADDYIGLGSLPLTAGAFRALASALGMMVYQCRPGDLSERTQEYSPEDPIDRKLSNTLERVKIWLRKKRA